MALSDEADLLARLDSLIAEVPSADHPYHACFAVTGLALDEIESEIGGGLYAMWSALQDWYELREEDAAEAIEAIRQAASEWPAVKEDRSARDNYFKRWRSTVRAAFQRPRRPAGPDRAVVGALDGEVVEYDEQAGLGLIRADAGDPTYVFRWDEIKLDAFFKTVEVGARVRFEARIDHAGERNARNVVPAG